MIGDYKLNPTNSSSSISKPLLEKIKFPEDKTQSHPTPVAFYYSLRKTREEPEVKGRRTSTIWSLHERIEFIKLCRNAPVKEVKGKMHKYLDFEQISLALKSQGISRTIKACSEHFNLIWKTLLPLSFYQLKEIKIKFYKSSIEVFEKNAFGKPKWRLFSEKTRGQKLTISVSTQGNLLQKPGNSPNLIGPSRTSNIASQQIPSQPIYPGNKLKDLDTLSPEKSDELQDLTELEESSTDSLDSLSEEDLNKLIDQAFTGHSEALSPLAAYPPLTTDIPMAQSVVPMVQYDWKDTPTKKHPLDRAERIEEVKKRKTAMSGVLLKVIKFKGKKSKGSEPTGIFCKLHKNNTLRNQGSTRNWKVIENVELLSRFRRAPVKCFQGTMQKYLDFKKISGKLKSMGFKWGKISCYDCYAHVWEDVLPISFFQRKKIKIKFFEFSIEVYEKPNGQSKWELFKAKAIYNPV